MAIDDLEPYENTLTVDELRREVRNCWDAELELRKAIVDMPEVPHWRVLYLLSSGAMNKFDWRYYNLGNELQKKHGWELVPTKTEYEFAAGLWSVWRNAMIAFEEKAREER